MALTPLFTAASTSDPTALLISDNSTGVDAAVVSRNILLYDIANNLVGSSPYIFGSFPFVTSITINPFTKDIAINIVVQWVNNSGGILYTKSAIFAQTVYGQQFYSGLTRNQTSNPVLLQDQQYFFNKLKLEVLLKSAQDAITSMADVYSAQSSINLYQSQQLIQNQQLNF